jgi:hypothetical protein
MLRDTPFYCAQGIAPVYVVRKRFRATSIGQRVPKRIPDPEIAAILTAVQKHSEGASRAARYRPPTAEAVDADVELLPL